MAYTLVPTELIVDGAITSAKLDTNITISGTLGVTGEVTLATHLNMGDNDKIKIGTGGDLEIYHDGSNSYISNSTGNIYLADTNGSIHLQAKLNEDSLVAEADGAVTLYHDNSPKLATSSSGVTVTGAAHADTVASTGGTTNNRGMLLAHQNNTNQSYVGRSENGVADTSNRITFDYDNDRMQLDSDGDIVLTPTSNVGIGNTSPNGLLHIGDANAEGDTTNPAIQIGGTSTYRMGLYTSAEGAVIENKNGDDGIQFRVKTAGEAMRIDGGTGRVGIGVSSPSKELDVVGTIKATGADNSNSMEVFAGTTTNQSFGLLVDAGTSAADYAARFRKSDNTVIMEVSGDGNVGIGTSGPSVPLHVNSTSGVSNRLAIFESDINNLNEYSSISVGHNTLSANFGLMLASSDTAYIGVGTSGNAFDATTGLGLYVNANGNVGINETSPAKLGLTGGSGKVLHLGGDDCQVRLANSILHHDNSGNTILHLRNNYGATSSSAQTKIESGFTTFHTGTSFTERMRIDSSGNLLVNQTSSNLTFGKLQVSAGGETAGHGGIVGFFDTDSSVASSNLIQLLSFSGDTDATGGQFIRFRDSNSVMGSVSAASGTTVAYNTSSDRRMKENIVDASSQLDVINNIQVREFDWKNNGHHEVGMIAQELNDVIPNVVQEGGEDVTEQPWGVDYGKLTPYLIKAVQEQQTIIDDLKTRIETLEG